LHYWGGLKKKTRGRGRGKGKGQGKKREGDCQENKMLPQVNSSEVDDKFVEGWKEQKRDRVGSN